MEHFLRLKESLWDFLAQIEYSSYYAYDLPDHPEWNDKPNGAININGRWLPDRPDGLTIGNREVFASLGIPDLTADQVYEYYQGTGQYNYHINPSCISFLVGPKKEHTFCKVLFNVFEMIDFFCEYTQNGKTIKKLLSQFESKKLYRILKTPMAVAEVNDGDLQITIVCFAPNLETPTDPSVICQYLLIRNQGITSIQNIYIGPSLVNYGSSWNANLDSESLNKGFQNVIVQSYEDKVTDSTQEQQYCFGIVGPIQNYFIKNTPENASNDSFFNQVEYTDINSLLQESDQIDQNQYFQIRNIGLCGFTTMFDELKPTQTVAIPWFILPSQSISDEISQFHDVIEWDLSQILQTTYEINEKWSNQILIRTSDDRLNDLIDSILNQLRIHLGYTSIHTGSVYYDHNRAFVRDNYWIQRALMKAGRLDAAQLNTEFMFQAWQNVGLRNSYNIETKSASPGTTEMRVEIPAIMSLNVEHLWRWTGDTQILTKYYPMVQNCLDSTLACLNNLFILNSDETWIWAAYVNEMDYYIDNSMTMIAGMSFGSKIASLLGFEEDYAHWHEKFTSWLSAMNLNFIIPTEKRYANGLDTSGYLDQSLVPSVVSHPITLRLWPILNQDQDVITSSTLIENGLNLIWDIMEPTGIIRSHTKTTAITGITLGDYLYAVSEFNLPFKNHVFSIVKNFPDCTASLYEIHDMFYPAWGTERRRPWDTATLLEGILHYLFGVEPEERSILFNPCPPQETGYAMIRDLPIKGKFYQVKCFTPEENYEFSLPLEDDENDVTRSQISNFIADLGENFVLSIQPVKEIAFKEPDQENYMILIQTDIIGRIRYYPDAAILEIGIEDNELMKPKIRFIKSADGSSNEIVLDLTLITDDFLLKIEEKIMFKFEIDDSQESGTLEIKNDQEIPLFIKYGQENATCGPMDKQKIQIELPNRDAVESLLDDHNDTYTPSDFFLHMNQFVTVNGTPHVTILYDEFSRNHAIEICKQLAIIKWAIYPIIPFNPDNTLLEQASGNNLILISQHAIEDMDQFKDLDILETFNSFSVYGFKECSNLGIVTLQNKGNVYDDTHDFCEQLGLYLIPTRNKAISMHPFGHYRLSDKIGMPADLPFNLKINASDSVNFYIAGNHTFSNQIETIFDPKQKVARFKPEKPYVSFYTIQPYCDFALSGGGIATGANCIRLVSECDADDSIEVNFEIQFDQTYQVIHLSGGQRERILDPISINKQPNGDKIVQITLHPGRNVHPLVCPREINAKKRSFTFTFARYPRFNQP